MRLNQYIAHSGLCSRREADELIKSGKVLLNGKPIENLSIRVELDDQVTVNGKLLSTNNKVYILLNKPRNFITTTSDDKERKTVMDLVYPKLYEMNEYKNVRLYPVGRLDRNTTGLLLLTNDGDLTQKLTHPKYEVEKLYVAELDKPLKAPDFEKIAKGLDLEDGRMEVDELGYPSGENKRIVGVAIHSGKNRIVRRLFEHLGYEVLKLDRIIYAGLTKKDLPRGNWRFLKPHEVDLLKMNKVTPKNSYNNHKKR